MHAQLVIQKKLYVTYLVYLLYIFRGEGIRKALFNSLQLLKTIFFVFDNRFYSTVTMVVLC